MEHWMTLNRAQSSTPNNCHALRELSKSQYPKVQCWKWVVQSWEIVSLQLFLLESRDQLSTTPD